MGVLARRFEHVFERRDWLTDDDALFEGPMTSAGTRVTLTTAMKLSTVWACVRLLTNTIATLPTDIIVSIGGSRFPEFTKPSWLVAPDPANPTMTSMDHFGQVAASLLTDGNFFTYAPLSVFDPSVLYVLPPTRVEILENPLRYRIRNKWGAEVAEVDPMHMLHGVWMRLPGQHRGLSPLEAARQGIGAGIATEDYAARFFGQGASLSFGVEVPGSLTADQKEEMRRSLEARYAGSSKSHAIGLLTGGAKFITGLGVTNEQSQFLASRKFTVEDIAGRIFGVPPHMVGSQEPGASSYNSVEQRSLEFREYSVLPLVRRIEDPYQRLVQVPERLRTSQATAMFRFNLAGIARADLKTRYESYSSGITGGFLRPNEARSFEDLPPQPGGDQLFIQSGTVPIGTVLEPPVRAEPAPPPTITTNVDARVMDGAMRSNVFTPPVNLPPEAVASAVGQMAERGVRVIESGEAMLAERAAGFESQARALLDAVEHLSSDLRAPRVTHKEVVRGPDNRIVSIREVSALEASA